MRVNTNSIQRPNGQSAFSVESFAAAHNLTRHVVSGKVTYCGKNPLDPDGAAADGFILFEAGNAWDRPTGKKYKRDDLRKFHARGEISHPIRSEQKQPENPKTGKRFDWRAPFVSFSYEDESGKLLFQVLRQGDGPNKLVSQRRPDARRESTGDGGWIARLGDVRRVLYKLPSVVAAHTVLVVEGEKAADYINRCLDGNGFSPAVVATCNPHGAGKWRAEFAESLREKTVHIFPDRDSPGERHAADVARSVHGVALATRIVELPDRSEKQGADDWLESGKHVAELLEFAEAAPLFVPQEPPTATPPETKDEGLPLSDIHNGEEFAREHGETVRFCSSTAEWMIFDGGIWKVDETGEVERRAKQTAKNALVTARALPDEEARSKHIKHALRLFQNASRATMIKDAASEPGMMVTLSMFDESSRLFNVANGTIDLSTGIFREHRAADLLMKQSKVSFDKSAICPLWLQSLARWIPDTERQTYIQDAVGMTVSGVIFDEHFNFLLGEGSNGKSVFLHVLESLMGGYGHKTQAETLMAARDPRKSEAPSPAILALKGHRLVTVQEIDTRHTIASGLIKDLTGRDSITARGVHEKRAVTFFPQFTLWMVGNSTPEITDLSPGMWRRPRMIEFSSPIAEHERDGQLRQKLERELPGILNWALEGLYRVQRRGVIVPTAIQDATLRYKTSQDSSFSFFDECCEFGIAMSIASSELRKAYEEWCADSEEIPKDAKKFASAMRSRKCEDRKRDGNKWWFGISLKTKFGETESLESLESLKTEKTDFRDSRDSRDSVLPNSQKQKKHSKGNHADSEVGYSREQNDGIFNNETTD